MQGSQQLRQLMGHSQFGARVVHGDCLFITMSPDPVKSTLVLRLSRYRRGDPYVQHSDRTTQRLAQQDYPSLEATHSKPVLSERGNSFQMTAETDDVEADVRGQS